MSANQKTNWRAIYYRVLDETGDAAQAQYQADNAIFFQPAEEPAEPVSPL